MHEIQGSCFGLVRHGQAGTCNLSCRPLQTPLLNSDNACSFGRLGAKRLQPWPPATFPSCLSLAQPEQDRIRVFNTHRFYAKRRKPCGIREKCVTTDSVLMWDWLTLQSKNRAAENQHQGSHTRGRYIPDWSG